MSFSAHPCVYNAYALRMLKKQLSSLHSVIRGRFVILHTFNIPEIFFYKFYKRNAIKKEENCRCGLR